jgi:hypothetical protein
MGDQILLKVMAFSVAVAIVVSCVMPCIAGMLLHDRGKPWGATIAEIKGEIGG